MIALLRRGLGLDWFVVAEELRVILVSLAALEAIGEVESLAGRPAVERARRTCFLVGRVVPLAERRRVVAMVTQHFRPRGIVLSPDAVVPRNAGGALGDAGHADLVVITSRQCGGWASTMPCC
jgi:hypothetical protein